MDREHLQEVFRQIWEGEDIPTPPRLLSRITPEQAARRLPGMPYSLLTNLAHTVFWQRIWVNRLKGIRAESITKDWRVPRPSEWEGLREEFLSGLKEAMAIVGGEPFMHKMKSDEAAVKTLLQIAIHDAYHIGQVNLLKRALRANRSA